MMQLARGHYTTRCGYKAFVSRVMACGMAWVCKGAIQDPDENISLIAQWDLDGIELGGRTELDLTEAAA